MIKIQVTYTTANGERKTRYFPYANPQSTNGTLKDFANALYNLSTNTVKDIYKIDTAVLLYDDSDDIVTPIETTGKLNPNLTLDKYTLENNVGSDTVIATYDGDGTLSVSNHNYPYYDYTVNGNQIVFKRNDEPSGSEEVTDTYVVTVSETADYQSDTATVTVVVGEENPYDDEELDWEP